MKKITKLLLGISFILTAGMTTGCEDGLIYEQNEACRTLVKFVYTKHRQALQSINLTGYDAFANTVESVHLFIYDNDSDELVAQYIKKTSELKSESDLGIGPDTGKNYLEVNLKPGNYRMIVWGGLDENNENNAFTLNELPTRGQYSDCSVKLFEKSLHPIHQEKYDFLFHGSLENVSLREEDIAHGIVYPIELTKDTNDIAIWVQHTTATFSEGEYEVVYVDANGTMIFDTNDVTKETTLQYLPHTTSLLNVDSEYNGSTVKAGALIAHISTSRLMAAHSDDARLEVRNKEGKTVFSIPFIQFVTEMQPFTKDYQYYLDCEDTYNCTFYLTGEKEDGTWLPARIIINNWAKVQDQGQDLDGDS